MMFNEYMDHANQCASYYSHTRKEEINLQQADTNRFKQKWLEVSGNNYPPPPPPAASAAQQNPTPPPLAQSQFNNTIKKEHHFNPQQQPHNIKQEPHAAAPYMNQFPNNKQNPYNKGPPSMQMKLNGNNPPPPGNFNHQQPQSMHTNGQPKQQHPGQVQYPPQQPSKYYEPQFIPNIKDNSNQHVTQPQKRQSPSPMILNNNNNINNSNPSNYSAQQQQQQSQQPQHNNYENPSKKFGMQQHPNNSTSNNINAKAKANAPNNGVNKPIGQVPNSNNNYGNPQKMYHHNGMMQGSNYPVNPQQQQPQSNQGHQGMQHQNYKPAFQQQQPAYMHHQQQQPNYHQQAPQQKHPQPQPPQQHNQQPQQHNQHPQQAQQNQQQHNHNQQPQHNTQQPQHNTQQSQQQQQHNQLHNQQQPQQKPYQNHEFNLDLKTAPRVNSPIHSNPSPYPQIHSNGPPESVNSPKESNGFNKKLSSSSLTQQKQQPHNKQPLELPIKSPAPPLRSTTPSLDQSANKILNENLVQNSPARMMSQSPSNSSLNMNICVGTPMNSQALIDLNQDQPISDDCDSGSFLSPLNTAPVKEKPLTSSLSFQNSKSSFLSEINIDELFMHYPKVFEELFYSFKLNSIEQIEHDLRTYCEQQFKLNFSNKNTNCSNSNQNTQQFSIRI